MKTFTQAEEWMIGAADSFFDPSGPVCQMFFRFVPDVRRSDLYLERDDLMFAIPSSDRIEIMFHRSAPLAVPVVCGSPVLAPDGMVEAFGLEKVAPGLWTLNPSLNLPEVVHFFATLYDVPDPAPWEQSIVLTDAAGREIHGARA